ncbi:MAG TPA: glycosyltransferase family 4 protein [Puia sp.]|jgi:glycosyltransferase involved in cell wall biosynthesis|nr:glycosyltransferase family 4 protein [Puia sp.]
MDNSRRPVRVLWFANTPGLSAGYLKISLAAGGWISSLQQVVEGVEECQLGFVFYTEQAMAPFEYGRTWYYPVQPLGSSKGRRLINRVMGRAERDENLPAFLRAVEQFKPDIIHVHGTEFPFGLILREVKDIPVVVSIQGNLTVYHEKYFAGLSLPGVWRGWRTGYPFHRADYRIWKKRMEVEQEILRRTKYVFGRTDWDRRVALALAPEAEYFHVDEVIRPRFYGLDWELDRKAELGRQEGKPVFFTTSSPSIYKGFEVVIDTARVLLAMGVEFEWRVAGLKEDHPLVRLTCAARKVEDLRALNIRLTGTLAEDALVDQLMNSDAYVQVSHIENSPNSVCEAMLAGIPVIASFAGGTGSLLRDGEQGVLVQDGDPYVLAGAMQEVIRQPERYRVMAAKGRKVAQRRHDPEVIVRGMMERYREIIQKSTGK